MLTITIPGTTTLELNHLVLDYNGTLAIDSQVIKQALPLLKELSKQLSLHILTADTHGNVEKEAQVVGGTIHIIGENNQAQEKLDYIKQLGKSKVVAIGNGKNDLLMLQDAGLGIGLVQTEGGYAKNIMAADIVCTSLTDGLNLLLRPERLIATMRC